MELLSPMHLLLVLGIALLVFGPRKLPELGKALGEAIRGFKTGIHGDGDDQKPAPRSTDGPENPNRPPSS